MTIGWTPEKEKSFDIQRKEYAELVEWVKSTDPKVVADTIMTLRRSLESAHQQMLEDSWRLNPDRMGQ